MKELLANKKLLYGLIIAFVLGLIYVLFFYNKKTGIQPTGTRQPAAVIKQEPVVNIDPLPNPSIKAIQKNNLIVSEDLVQFIPEALPSELEIFSYQSSSLLTEQNISTLAKSFNLGQIKTINSPVQGKVLISSNENGSIIAEIDSNNLSISFTKPETEDKVGKVNINEFITISKDFINLIGVDVNKYPKVKYAYTVDSKVGLQVVNKPEDAEKVEIIFESTTPNNYPLIDKNFSLNPNQIKVFLNPKKEILGLAVEDYGTIGSPITTTKIKTKEQVIKDLKDGKAMIFNLEALSKKNIIFTTVKTVTLSYTVLGNKLIPVFVVTGNTDLAQVDRMRGTAEMQLILEAEIK